MNNFNSSPNIGCFCETFSIITDYKIQFSLRKSTYTRELRSTFILCPSSWKPASPPIPPLLADALGVPISTLPVDLAESFANICWRRLLARASQSSSSASSLSPLVTTADPDGEGFGEAPSFLPGFLGKTLGDAEAAPERAGLWGRAALRADDFLGLKRSSSSESDPRPSQALGLGAVLLLGTGGFWGVTLPVSALAFLWGVGGFAGVTAAVDGLGLEGDAADGVAVTAAGVADATDVVVEGVWLLSAAAASSHSIPWGAGVLLVAPGPPGDLALGEGWVSKPKISSSSWNLNTKTNEISIF